MTGPEGYIPSNPLEAVGWITPEGYNVDNLEQAIAYLAQDGRNPYEFDPKGESDVDTSFHLAFGMQNVLRAAFSGKDTERRQSVSEHNMNMTVIGLSIIDKHNLPINKVQYVERVPLHDAKEQYADDTVLGDAEREASKPFRERAGRTILRDRYKNNPRVLAILDDLEDPSDPVNEFLDNIDKVEPTFVARATKCKTQIERGETFELFVTRVVSKIFHNKLILNEYALPIIDDIGRKWESWGGIPFEGDHMAITQRIILDHQTKLHELGADEDVLVAVTDPRWSAEERQKAAALALQAYYEGQEEMAPVASLAEHRAKRRPLPPTPPNPGVSLGLVA